MTSSYSDLGLELMVTGENAGTWGDKTNQNINLIQQAIAGFEQVTLSSGGTLTLAMTDETLSNARNMVIKFATASIAASTICTIPDSIEKFYIFDATGLTNPANLTIKTASGTGFTLNAAKIFAAYSDGTNLNEISLDTLGGTIAAADITGTISTAQIADNAVTTAKVSDLQITTAKIADNQITTAKIADNQITTAKVSDLQITTAKIADDAVTPDKLSNTAVTAGTYTSATLTVDAQGRLTAASSGGGAAVMKTLIFRTGPASGSVTLSPTASKVQAFLFGGGGAGGRGSNNSPGGNGGDGGFGFFAANATGGSTIPYSIGGGGASTNAYSPGGSGGATNFHNFTANGANGGGWPSVGSNPGNPGNAPGTFGTISRGILFSPGNASGAGKGGEGGRPGAGNSGSAGGLWILSDEG